MLFRKMLRDLWRNKTQFISIFIMSFLGLWIFVGLDAEANGADYASKNYYKQYNLADLWVSGSGFDDDDLRLVKNIRGVKDAEKRICLTGKETGKDDSYFYIHFINSNNISQIVLKEGDRYSENEDGIWIAYEYAKANNIEIGDTFSLKIDNMQVDEPVRGLIESPEYVYYVSESDIVMPNYNKTGIAYLSSDLFPDRDLKVYNQIIVDIEDNADSDAIKQQIEDDFDREDIAVTDRDQNLSYETFDAEISQHKTMGIMFAGVFMAIAVMGIVTTMARVTSNQRTQIGTLKALGFSKRAVTFHYMSYGVFISFLGNALGAIIGILTVPPLILGMFVGSYIVPNLKGHATVLDYEMIAISTLVSALVSFLSCRKELKDPPAVTLRPRTAKKVKSNRFRESKLWLSLDFATQWNIRDITRNKMRTLMGIFGVMGCCMLLLTGFGCMDSINAMMDKAYGELVVGKNKIMLTNCDYGYAYDLAEKYKGQMVQSASIEIVTESEKKNATAVITDDGNLMHFQDEDENEVRIPDGGVGMTAKIQKQLGVSVGDIIRWHVVGDDKWKKCRIDFIVRDPMTQGLVMNKDTFESMEDDFVPSYILTNMSLPEDLAEDDSHVQTVLDISQMKADFAKNMEMMYTMIALMVIAAALLGIVVLYNLGVLSFVEKTREVATLKVLGFKSKKIRTILQRQNLWITLVGIIVGIWAGLWMLEIMCGTMSDTLDMYSTVYLPSYLYSVVGTFLVSSFVNLMFSGKVKTIDMVDALKGVE